MAGRLTQGALRDPGLWSTTLSGLAALRVAGLHFASAPHTTKAAEESRLPSSLAPLPLSAFRFRLSAFGFRHALHPPRPAPTHGGPRLPGRRLLRLSGLAGESGDGAS